MKSRRAFTLVELIVVIGILGILMGVLLISFGGGSASARAARCLSNMKNLANAAQTYGMQSWYYPLAGNLVYMVIAEQGAGRRPERKYYETPGWISANSMDMFPSASYSKPEVISMYTDNDDEAWYALTNGVLWKYVSGSSDAYVCPEHKKKMPNARWSYLMNAYFGFDQNDKPRANKDADRRGFSSFANAEKRLLFSEVPFMGYNKWQPSGSGGTDDTDAILQYGTSSDLPSASKGCAGKGASDEEIGVNHVSGRSAFAHVAFADGHVEKLRVPMNGKKPDTSGFAELTSWLCAGLDVSFDGKGYKYVNQ